MENGMGMYLRSVHPTYYRDGQILARGFYPTEADNGFLSGYDGSKISAAAAYEHRTKEMKKESVGIWGVTTEEVGSLQLPYRADPMPGIPSHMVIDFNRVEAKEQKARAAILAALAQDRGKMFPGTGSDSLGI